MNERWRRPEAAPSTKGWAKSAKSQAGESPDTGATGDTTNDRTQKTGPMCIGRRLLEPCAHGAGLIVAASLAYLGQLDEAREALERVPPQSAEQLQRWQQRPPWMRPEDYALRVEGVHLAAGERVECDAAIPIISERLSDGALVTV